ncbi:MAG: hypothetical protein ACK4X1_15475 [Terricaulis sp.]
MTAKFAPDFEATPRLRLDMNLGTLWALPAWSSAPVDFKQLAPALRELGVEGVQGLDPSRFREAGFRVCGMERVDGPGEASRIAEDHRARGYDLTTLHVGNGLERDADMDALAAAVIEASIRFDYPLFIETHRATMTQDMRRTIDLVERFPDLRFNADLSHWYTGQEMTYGDFEARLHALEPVFARVRYMHGRIGDPGAIQRSLVASAGEPFVADFRRMWRACFRGFLETAAPGEVLPFAPELLPHSVKPRGKSEIKLYYARLATTGKGRLSEESDRWVDAKAMLALAREDFDIEAAERQSSKRRSASR